MFNKSQNDYQFFHTVDYNTLMPKSTLLFYFLMFLDRTVFNFNIVYAIYSLLVINNFWLIFSLRTSTWNQN